MEPRPPSASRAAMQERVSYFTLDEVNEHKRRGDMWLLIHGKVYNVTRFLEDVPAVPARLCVLSAVGSIPVARRFYSSRPVPHERACGGNQCRPGCHRAVRGCGALGGRPEAPRGLLRRRARRGTQGSGRADLRLPVAQRPQMEAWQPRCQAAHPVLPPHSHAGSNRPKVSVRTRPGDGAGRCRRGPPLPALPLFPIKTCAAPQGAKTFLQNCW